MTKVKWTNPTGLRCPKCKSVKLIKDGTFKRWINDKGKQRYRCWMCGAVTIAPLEKKARKKSGKETG